MSSSDPEGSTNPEKDLTPTEVENLDRLEAVAQEGLGAYVQVADALAEIRDRHLYRDSHASFEAYIRERWGVVIPNGDQPSETTILAEVGAMATAEPAARAALPNKPCEALARACEQTLSALAGDDRVGIEIRLAVRKSGDPGVSADEDRLNAWKVGEATGDDLLPTLRWLLSQASGTIGEVAHQLETRAVEIDDGPRAQLRDDVLVLDGELAVVKALLLQVADWDSELTRLLTDELPPFDADTDPDDDE